MKKETAMRLMLLGCLLAAVSCSSSEEQEKILLKGDLPKGLVVIREITEKVDGSLSVRSEGTDSRQTLYKDEHRIFEDEILDSDDGRVLKVRRKTVAWRLNSQKPGDAAPVSVPRKMVGKSIVMTRTDLGTIYDEADGIPEDELRMNLLGSLEALVSPPAEPVAVGSDWPLDGEHIVEMFGGDGSSRPLKVREVVGTGRLEKIEGGVGHIAVKLTAHGSFRSLLDVDVELQLTARFRFDVATKRLKDMDAHADGKIAGAVDRKGKAALYSGAFTFDSKGTVKYR